LSVYSFILGRREGEKRLQLVQYIYFELIKSCYARLYELTGIVIVRYISIDGKKPIENFSSIMKGILAIIRSFEYNIFCMIITFKRYVNGIYQLKQNANALL